MNIKVLYFLINGLDVKFCLGLETKRVLAADSTLRQSLLTELIYPNVLIYKHEGLLSLGRSFKENPNES